MDVDVAAAYQGLARPFLGRERELARIGELLADPLVRLVTVTGPAGVGKTRLAAEYATQHVNSTVVVTVDLSAVTDIGLVDDAIVSRLPATPEVAVSATDRLWGLYGGEPVLLVLNNLEQIEGGAQAVLRLLNEYEALTVLVTSITPVRVVGEHVLRLGPFPEADDPEDDLSVALFRNRASAADADFVLDAETVGPVVAICRALGGLPLAIELAAARVVAVPPRLMARQLAGRDLDRIVHQRGTVGAPSRHLSVTAALDWTARMLAPAAVDILTQVAVFEGPFMLSAAAAVVRPTLDPPDLLDLLSELVDGQLLTLDASLGDEPSFGMSRLVRTFALRRLRASGLEASVRDAHASYWRLRCQVGVDVSRHHWPDVEAALDHTMLRGWTVEALTMAVAAAPALASLPGAEAALLPRMEMLLAKQEVRDEALAARAIIWSALHTPVSEDDLQTYGMRTAQRLARSVELARASGDDTALLRALEVTVVSLSITFDLEAALSAKQEGLELATRLGDESTLARFEVYDAMAAAQAGDHERSLVLARRAYERGDRVADDEAVTSAALILRRAPTEMVSDLEPPLPNLETLLQRAQGPHQQGTRLFILSAIVSRELSAGDILAAVRSIDRLLMLAAAHERTLPLAGLAPVMAMTQVAISTGALEDAVRLRESIARLEPLLPALLPEPAGAYLAAVADLRTRVTEQRYAELAAEVTGRSITQANRLATAIVRAFLVKNAPSKRRGPPSAKALTRPTGLTPREAEVLGQLARGGTNRDVAATLGITPKTVMHHTMAIYRKLGVRGRAEATAWAFRHGLVEHD